MQPDPLGYAAGDVEVYGYCMDDPVNLVDPLGLLGISEEENAYLREWVYSFANEFKDYASLGSGRVQTIVESGVEVASPGAMGEDSNNPYVHAIRGIRASRVPGVEDPANGYTNDKLKNPLEEDKVLKGRTKEPPQTVSGQKLGKPRLGGR